LKIKRLVNGFTMIFLPEFGTRYGRHLKCFANRIHHPGSLSDLGGAFDCLLKALGMTYDACGGGS